MCNSACLAKVDDVATCDPQCTERTGQCVFVDDDGGVTPMKDPQQCKGFENKPAKMSGRKHKETEKERERDLRIREMQNNAS
jgi:hypothetical protein